VLFGDSTGRSEVELSPANLELRLQSLDEDVSTDFFFARRLIAVPNGRVLRCQPTVERRSTTVSS
jgi:hypothetical protein